MASPFNSIGAKLEWCATQNGTYALVGDYAEFQGLDGFEVGTGMITKLGDTDAIHRYLAGWIKPGTISGTIYADKTKFATLLGLVKGRASNYWRASWDDETTSSKLEYQAILTKVSVDPFKKGEDDPIKIMFEAQISGNVTFTEGSTP